MAKEKVTITLDRTKAALALRLLGAASTSAVVDLALERLIQAERLRRDVDAYRRQPPSPADAALAAIGDSTGLDDDTDWELLYAGLRS